MFVFHEASSSQAASLQKQHKNQNINTSYISRMTLSCYGFQKRLCLYFLPPHRCRRSSLVEKNMWTLPMHWMITPERDYGRKSLIVCLGWVGFMFGLPGFWLIPRPRRSEVAVEPTRGQCKAGSGPSKPRFATMPKQRDESKNRKTGFALRMFFLVICLIFFGPTTRIYKVCFGILFVLGLWLRPILAVLQFCFSDGSKEVLHKYRWQPVIPNFR